MVMGNSQKLTVLSLFSGCGGMDLGAELAGMRVIYANELVPLFCETLKVNFPNTEIVPGDIKEIKSFPKADVVTGGYPCQSFSMGGKRDPKNDHRTYLYLEYARVLDEVNPKFFVAENVSGLSKLRGGMFLKEQLEAFKDRGEHGYEISYQICNVRDYGIPQKRKRIVLVGVRKDLGLRYKFPDYTHGPKLLPYTSHGDVIKDLPLWPEGEFYERPDDKGNFSWYFMSRNRKAKWDEPAYTVVANWRHTTIHPASPTMKLEWSDLANGWKQKWYFSDEYEHLEKDPTRPKLDKPRRLSWHELARIQTFPDTFKFVGNTEQKITQIGNAVPVRFAEIILKAIADGSGLVEASKVEPQPTSLEQVALAVATS
jgi:DNA (cytosine-5)-methyltransferase 1